MHVFVNKYGFAFEYMYICIYLNICYRYVFASDWLSIHKKYTYMYLLNRSNTDRDEFNFYQNTTIWIQSFLDELPTQG